MLARNRIRNETSEILIGSGVAPGEASAYGVLVSSILCRLAESFGSDASDLLEQFRITVERTHLHEFNENRRFQAFENDVNNLLGSQGLPQVYELDATAKQALSFACMTSEFNSVKGDDGNTPQELLDAAKEIYDKLGYDSALLKEFLKDSYFDGSRERGPFIVYHGTPREEKFTSFDMNLLGDSSGHASSELGIFATGDVSLAKKYAEQNGQVLACFARMSNPKFIESHEVPQFDTGADAAKYRKQLMAQGYDGIVIKCIGSHDQYVFFDSRQLKNVNNRGTFDPDSPNIYHQTAEDGHEKGCVVISRKDTGVPVFNVKLFDSEGLNGSVGFDGSTLPHEMAHVYLEGLDVTMKDVDLADFSKMTDDEKNALFEEMGPERAEKFQEYLAIRSWMGLEPGDSIPRFQHERFADAFEA